MNTIDIDTVINKVITREQLSDHHYARLLDIAVDGYKDIFKKIMPDYKTLLLTWDNDDERFINYPSDYSSYIIVGVPFIMPNGNMSILTLSKNDLLYFDKPRACECNCTLNVAVEEPVSNTLELLSTGYAPFNQMFPFGRTYRNGQYVGEMYGLGGGQSFMGSFTDDTRNKRFVFGRDVPKNTEIVLRYKPVAIDYSQALVGIPADAEESLIAWTQWKMLNRRNSTKSERDEAEYLYICRRDEFNMNLNGPTASEIEDAFYEGLCFTVAR
jgi:hypothetical protein